MSKFSDEWGRFTVLPNLFIEGWKELSDAARLLFVVLRYHTNEEKEYAWPSYDQLQNLTGWGRSKISAAIQELEKYGWLERRKRFGSSVQYVLKRPSSPKVGLLENKELTPSSPETPSSPTVRTTVVPMSRLQKSHNRTTASLYEQDELTRRKEQDESMSNIRSTAGGEILSPAQEVFDYWRTTLNHPKAKFDKKRARLIKARLDEGYPVHHLKAAVDGCKASPFHQGDNDRFRKYDAISLIFRDAEHVEQFIAMSPVANRTVVAPKKEYCGECYQGWLPSDPEKGRNYATRCSCVEADRGGAPPVVTAAPVWNAQSGRFIKPVRTTEEDGIRPPQEIGVTYCGQCENGWVFDRGLAKPCGCEMARKTGKDNYTHYSDGRAKPAHMIGFVA